MRQFAVLMALFGFLFLNFTQPSAQNPKSKGEFDQLNKAFDSLRIENLNAVIPYLDSMYQRYTLSRNVRGKGLVQLKIGDIHQQKAQFQAAQEAYEEALEIFNTIGDELNLGMAYSGLGTVLGRQGNLTVANDYLIAALEIYEKHQHDMGIGGIYIKLGVINVMLRNYERGIEHYKKALPYALKTDTHNVITIYNNIGGAYLYMDSLDRSIPFFEQALSFATSEKFGEAQTLALSNLALTYNKRGDKAQAIHYYERAIELAERHQMLDQVLLIRTNKIRIFSEENPIQAKIELADVFQSADSLKLYSIAIATINQLIDINKEVGTDKETIHWLEEKVRVAGIMYDESKAREIAEVQSLYELNKSQEDLAVLHEKIIANRKMNLYLATLILTLLTGLIIVFSLNRRRKRINAMLKLREKELEEKDRVKDRLFSIIGHDIKGAFSTQSMCLGLFEDKFQEPEPDVVVLLDAMRNNLNEVNHILDTLLHWGKVQIKGVHLNRQLFGVNEDIHALFEQFSVNSSLKGQKLVNLLPPGTAVFADRDHFKFILRNLIANAIKYSFKGGTVKVGLHATLTPDTTTIYIKDEGIGIKDEIKDQVFKPFHESQEGTNKELGNSLALMICQEFMTLNQGRIWFESNEGPGVTFFVQFPDRVH